MTKQDEIQRRWKEHFLVLNGPASKDTVFKEMKNRTAGRVDSLTVEILKADMEISVDVINNKLIINCVKNRQVSGKAEVQRIKYLYCATSLNRTITFMSALST